MEGPIGDPALRLTLEGAGFAVPARISGKSYRRVLRTVAKKGAENVTVIFQGELVAPPDGGPARLTRRGSRLSSVPSAWPRPTASRFPVNDRRGRPGFPCSS